MKRDEDLIRKILLIIENGGGAFGELREKLRVIDYTYEQVGYHCYLLKMENLIDAVDVGCMGDNCAQAYTPLSLTHEGHKYIEKIKNDSNWLSRTKSFFKDCNINILSININS